MFKSVVCLSLDDVEALLHYPALPCFIIGQLIIVQGMFGESWDFAVWAIFMTMWSDMDFN